MAKERKDPLTAAGYRVTANAALKPAAGTMTNLPDDWPPIDPRAVVVDAEMARLRMAATLRGFKADPGLWALTREHMLAAMVLEGELLRDASSVNGRKGPSAHPYASPMRKRVKQELNKLDPAVLWQAGTTAKVAKTSGAHPSYVARIRREDYPRD